MITYGLNLEHDRRILAYQVSPSTGVLVCEMKGSFQPTSGYSSSDHRESSGCTLHLHTSPARDHLFSENDTEESPGASGLNSVSKCLPWTSERAGVHPILVVNIVSINGSSLP